MSTAPKPSDQEEESKTSHMNRSDLDLLLAALNAARADAAAAASIVDTQKMPADLHATLQEALQNSEAHKPPAIAPVAPIKSAAVRRSEFAAVMAQLTENGRSFVQVAIAKAQVNASGAPDDFVADYLRSEVVRHAALGTLEALLAEMAEPHYTLKIATAYAAPRIS